MAPYQTPIEKRTLRGVKAASESSEADDPNKIRIARRAACELRDGMYVNLGECLMLVNFNS